ncbi:MAG: type 4a pilus biogenesis protein PilO [Armatimonadota bacterium]
MKSYSSKMERRFLAALCAIIALAGVASIYWLFTMQSSVDSELLTINNRLQETQAVARKLEDANRRLKSAEGQLRYLELSVTERSYVPTLLKQLQIAAKQYRLNVVSVRLENAKPVPAAPSGTDAAKAAPPAKKIYDEQDIQLSVSGRFWDCMQFLDGLTRFPKIVNVKRVDIRPKPRLFRADPQTVDMQISLTAFMFKDEVAAR